MEGATSTFVLLQHILGGPEAGSGCTRQSQMWSGWPPGPCLYPETSTEDPAVPLWYLLPSTSQTGSVHKTAGWCPGARIPEWHRAPARICVRRHRGLAGANPEVTRHVLLPATCPQPFLISIEPTGVHPEAPPTAHHTLPAKIVLWSPSTRKSLSHT